MIEMQSVALINGSKKYDGMLISSLSIKQALNQLGYNTQWYQCMDGGKTEEYYSNGKRIIGYNLGSETLSIGVNRLFVFHKMIGKLQEDIVFLSDPTLIKVAQNNSKVIVKLHDLIPLTEFRPKISGYFMFKYVTPKLKDVDRLIVTTSHMKSQAVDLNIPEEKIFVVPDIPGFQQDQVHIMRSMERIESGEDINVLYVATDKPYKNITYFLLLAKKLSLFNGGKRFKFHLVSKLKHSTKSLIEDLGIKNVKLYENVEDIRAIYDLSDILLYPSLYEGYGLPLIEAMFHGIPIITNKIQPFIELLGESGLYADSSDVDSWIKHLLFLSKPEYYKEYALKSYERSCRYTWEQFRNHIKTAFEGM